MLVGTTKSGFDYNVSPGRLNNYEFLESLSKLEQNPLEYPRVLELLLGEEQKKALMEHLRDEEGMVPIQAVQETFEEIILSHQNSKN